MISSASGWPSAAARSIPNICSALGLNSMILPRSSIVIRASRAASMIADFTASLSWMRSRALRWAWKASAAAPASGCHHAGRRGAVDLWSAASARM